MSVGIRFDFSVRQNEENWHTFVTKERLTAITGIYIYILDD